ncbi:hypothetical protein Droror1_Dr00004064 [Drosera rotundifolia]
MDPNPNPNPNPLLGSFTFPPYDAVLPRHVVPGIRSLLAQLEVEVEELERSVVEEPVYEELVVRFERVWDRLKVVWGIVSHLVAVRDSEELRAAIEQVQPDKVRFELRLSQSKPIYIAFKTIRESPDWNTLTEARKRLVEGQLKMAILGGISLEDDKRKRFNEIKQELEKLALKFEGNILDAVKSYEKLLTNKNDVEGLPATALGLAAQMAVSKGHTNATAGNGPWVITLNPPSYRSVMQHSPNRPLREELYRAYVKRASFGDTNNTPIIEQILKLRYEMAKLLGYNNYAELSMETKMATVEQAEKLIEDLRVGAWNAAVQDMEDIKKYAESHGAEEVFDWNNWDINFWSERLRESRYGINEEELRPFFSLPKVIDGLFDLTKKLFDIDICPADGEAPVWHDDIKFFRVNNSLGSPIAYFYLDPYSRPSDKRGGAWMDEAIGRSHALSRDGTSIRLPVAHVVCNQTPPIGDKPSLMTFQEVVTIFHEFGHALQLILTKQDEGLVSGLRGIEWDAVEVASQFMENWCYQRDMLMRITKHYETGENLPEEICMKILSARTFRAGSELLRQLRFACIDLALHSKYIPGGSEAIYDIDQSISRKTHVIPLLPEDRFLCSFSHIFADTYAAGYYSYWWAEVMSADAFSAFDEVGLDNDKSVREMGIKFRDTILAVGGGRSPLEVFIDFRGRKPSVEPLLRSYRIFLVAEAVA